MLVNVMLPLLCENQIKAEQCGPKPDEISRAYGIQIKKRIWLSCCSRRLERLPWRKMRTEGNRRGITTPYLEEFWVLLQSEYKCAIGHIEGSPSQLAWKQQSFHCTTVATSSPIFAWSYLPTAISGSNISAKSTESISVLDMQTDWARFIDVKS